MIWQRAWWITKQSLRRSKIGFLISVLLNIYLSVIIGFMSIREIYSIPREQLTWRETFVTDGLLLICVSVMGFVMTKDYRTYWSSDSFTRRLVFLRAMPIRVEEIVLARFQQMVVCMLLLSASFFLPLYYFSGFADQISVWQYIEWAVTWLGISIMIGGFYVYVELGTTGKQYLLVSFLVTGLTLMAAIAIGLTGFSLFLTTVDLIEQYGLLVPILSHIVGFVIMLGWIKLCERRIRTRKYAR